MRFRWSAYYEDLEDERRLRSGQPPKHAASAHEKQQQLSLQGNESAGKGDGTPASSSSDPTSPADNPLFPHIPYLVYPTYSGDVLAIDYHAAAAAAAASTPQDVARIARDEANYAAQQLRSARALARQQRDRVREARRDRKAARTSSSRRNTRKAGTDVHQLGGEDTDEPDALARAEVVADHFDSVSFLPSDLLPLAHGPPIGLGASLSPAGAPIGGHEEEAIARRRAAAVVRLGAGTTPSAWRPPASARGGGLLSLFSSGRGGASGRRAYGRPSKPVAASMAQRMAALGAVYGLGLQLDQLSLSSSSSPSFSSSSSSSPNSPDSFLRRGWAERQIGVAAAAAAEGAGAAAGGGAAGDGGIWSLSHSTFSAWFPPPYRVLTLVALGIFVFAADVLVLSRLGIDPVPLLFPASAASSAGAAASAASRGGSGRGRGLPLRRSDAVGSGGGGRPHAHAHANAHAHGLGPGLTSARQLSRALFLLAAVYALLGLGGWASFRIYVDSIVFLGDPSGRHAQALQGLAVGVALGLACWPGRFLFRPVRVAFWKALGRLLWPSSYGPGHPASLGSKSKRSVGPAAGNGNGIGSNGPYRAQHPASAAAAAAEENELADEMGLFDAEAEDTRRHAAGDDDDDDARELLHPSVLSTAHGRQRAASRARTYAHRLRLALRDARRWVQPPSFSAVILADVLTSFAKVFADVWLTACFLVPRKEHHTWWNGRGSVVVPILTSLPYLIRLRQCISEYLSTTPTYSKHPAPLRGGPPSRKPLWNALKYFSALPVIWLAALEGFASSELAAWEAGLSAEGRVNVLGVSASSADAGAGGVHLAEGTRMMRRDLWAWGEEARWRQRLVWRCWLFWVFFNSIFSFWWDVTHDWGLDMFKLRTVTRIISHSQTGEHAYSTSSHSHSHSHSHAHHSHRRALSSVVLRPATKPLLFPEWAYHLSIVLDLILRFTWSIKLSSQLYRYADWEGGVFVFEALEIVRRGAWVVLRFEHAALGSFVGVGGAGPHFGGAVSLASTGAGAGAGVGAPLDGVSIGAVHGDGAEEEEPSHRPYADDEASTLHQVRPHHGNPGDKSRWEG